jgi:uncharacterized protein
MRPCKNRRILNRFSHSYFKPKGIPMSCLRETILFDEEIEALRLKNIQKLSQLECAKEMNISQSTFQRILSSAYNKVSDAIVNGKAIRVVNRF